MVVRNTRDSRGHIKGYGCGFHHRRGSAVCPVTLCQPVAEIEGALVDYIRSTILTEAVVGQVLREIRVEVERAAAEPSDVVALEAERERLRGEQKKYARQWRRCRTFRS